MDARRHGAVVLVALASAIGVARAQPEPDAGSPPPSFQRTTPDDNLSRALLEIDKTKGIDTSKWDRNAGRTHGRITGSVTTAKLEVEGGRSREEVAAAVEQLRSQVHDCYLRALNRKPDLQGKLELRWTIDAGGSVGSLKLQPSNLNGNEVVSCALTRVRRWKFPESRGGPATVSCTFVLQPLMN